MSFDRVEITLGGVAFCVVMFLIISVAGFVGVAAWNSSEKAAAYHAYTECLRAMNGQTIDVQQTFCGRIREQL